jgi:hypothetical protein
VVRVRKEATKLFSQYSKIQRVCASLLLLERYNCMYAGYYQCKSISVNKVTYHTPKKSLDAHRISIRIIGVIWVNRTVKVIHIRILGTRDMMDEDDNRAGGIQFFFISGWWVTKGIECNCRTEMDNHVLDDESIDDGIMSPSLLTRKCSSAWRFGYDANTLRWLQLPEWVVIHASQQDRTTIIEFFWNAQFVRYLLNV